MGYVSFREGISLDLITQQGSSWPRVRVPAPPSEALVEHQRRPKNTGEKRGDGFWSVEKPQGIHSIHGKNGIGSQKNIILLKECIILLLKDDILDWIHGKWLILMVNDGKCR